MRSTPRSVVLALLMAGMVGCSNSTRITTHAAGHPISARIQGRHSIDTQDDRGVIVSDYGKVTIERTRIQVNDSPWTKIPEGAAIQLTFSKGFVSVTTGSITVSHTTR